MGTTATNNLENEIRSLVAEIMEIDEEKITPDAKFVEDLGMDSMMALEVLASAEKKYKIKISEDYIMKVTDLKSARYSFVGPLTIGAKLAGGKSSQLDALSKFGQAVGKAFQIQDDILGVFGDEKITGKSSLLDLREGKNTLLIYRIGVNYKHIQPHDDPGKARAIQQNAT